MRVSGLLIKNGQVVRERGIMREDILIENGIIKDVKGTKPGTGTEEMEASNLLVFPGLIDCHVHFRDPGMEDAEDMMTGSLAALHGGITTVCDMPNTVPATCTRKNLDRKIRKANKIFKCRTHGCDIKFFFGVTKREHLDELSNVNTSDIAGVKLYLGNSTGNQKAEEGIDEMVFKMCSEKGITVVCHCEDEEIIRKNKFRIEADDIYAHSKIRSVEAAAAATRHAIALGKKYGARLHIAHISTADELMTIKLAKESGQAVTCEAAPHHLFMNTGDYASLGTLAKINPPLRAKTHCDALMNGLADGTIDCVASDHAPHTLKSKQTEKPLNAPSGVPGVETTLPILLSNGFAPTNILRLMFTNPNRIFGLSKSGISVGKPANLCLVNPTEEWIVHGANLHSKCGWTPYEGWKVRGKIVKVVC